MQKKVIIRGSVQKFQFFGLDFYLSGAKLGEENWYLKNQGRGKKLVHLEEYIPVSSSITALLFKNITVH